MASHTVQTAGHGCIARKHMGRKGCQNSSPSALLFMSQPPQLSHNLSLSSEAPHSSGFQGYSQDAEGSHRKMLCASVLATKSPPSLAERLLSFFLTTAASPKTFKTTSSSLFSIRSQQREGTEGWHRGYSTAKARHLVTSST